LAGLQGLTGSKATNLSTANTLFATRARNALWLQFFEMGVVSMALAPKTPELKKRQMSYLTLGLVWFSLQAPQEKC
jgi:hypothetical protein